MLPGVNMVKQTSMKGKDVLAPPPKKKKKIFELLFYYLQINCGLRLFAAKKTTRMCFLGSTHGPSEEG